MSLTQKIKTSLGFLIAGSFFLVPALLHAQPQPNIIWIVCEDISPFISSYGNHEIKTPNIDRLAAEGIRYTAVYTTAGVCAPSRSSIITGMYQTSIGTQHMRTIGDPKYQPVPSYSAVVPDYVKCFPEYLRKAGYYCTNNQKQDYQFEPPVTVWDENSAAASYRNRPQGKPFFAVYNFAVTHESMLFLRHDSLLVDTNALTVPPIYPDTKTVRHDIARLFTNIEIMDRQVGELLDQLRQDGLYDRTIIFFYSDHGGSLPWMKREILERGTHIPFIIRFPGAKNAGTVNDQLISSVDFAPTVLSLAGVKIPAYMQGQAFEGAQKSAIPRMYVFAGRDRMDTEYDRVRMVRDRRYRYLVNYMPEKTYYQNIEYRLSIPMMKEILALRDAGKLDSNQASWFHSKPPEELYDVQNDPYELHNLVNDPADQNQLEAMRTAYREWLQKTGDRALVPEKQMITQMWEGKDAPPATAPPVIKQSKNALLISCATKGASIGYRISKAGVVAVPEKHAVQSWDFGVILGGAKNGTTISVAPAWNIYKDEPIKLQKGDTLTVNAMRIGYRPAIVKYVDGKIFTMQQ